MQIFDRFDDWYYFLEAIIHFQIRCAKTLWMWNSNQANWVEIQNVGSLFPQWFNENLLKDEEFLKKSENIFLEKA